MEIFLKFDISFFSVVLLFMVYVIIRIRKDRIGQSTKLFQRLIWVTIYMLLLEILSWQFDGKAGIFNYYANYITNMTFAWSTTLVTCVWASYMDYHMFNSIERLKRRLYYMYPMIINTIFIIINFFIPFIFSVDNNNIYSREPFMWLIVIQNAIFFIYLWKLAYTNRKIINKEVIFSILLFIILPTFASAVQVLIYGAFILWPTMAITIVITYIFLETVSTSKDYLTGLFSRHRLDDYIDYKISLGKSFGIIMIDLDGFKKINDNYGHISGDNALKIFSKALTYIANSDMIIGRYAGDEFLVITNILSKDDLKYYIEELEKKLLELQFENDIEYSIKFSLGYSEWCNKENYDYETLINIADSNMYSIKNSKNSIK